MNYYLDLTLKSMGKKVLFLSMVLVHVFAHAAADTIVVNHINDVTHIEISGLGASDYQINKKEKTVVLKINQLGDEKLTTLKNYKDKHILGVDIQKSPALDQDIITLRLASGSIEMFDYLTDAPSSLSIDFYYDDEKEAKLKSQNAKSGEEADQDEDGVAFDPTQPQKDNKKQKKVAQKIEENDYKHVPIERQLASGEFIKAVQLNTQLLSDLDQNKKIKSNLSDKEDKSEKKIRRYYEAQNPLEFDAEKIKFPIDILIEARDKVFLRFPLLLNESEYLKNIISRSVSYEIEEQKDIESLDFVKAKKMFDKKDFKSFFKSKKIFNKKYPKSKYTEMISFMAADALLLTYEKEKSPELLSEALITYDSLVSKYPASSITERTYLLLGYIRMQEEKYLDAARSLKTYVELYKNSPLRENIKLILAQSLMRTKQYKDAGVIYDELSKTESADVREAAAFDTGDVFLEKKDYVNAIKYYSAAIDAYPQAVKKYDNIYFNLAEAQFMNEDYKDSLKSYRTFIEQHPQNKFSGYAWTRIGEILEIANKDEKTWRGFYNESIFRFNNEEGARIARIHLIRHDSVKAPESKLKIYIDELKALAKDIHLGYIEDFIAFKISDIYYSRGNFKESVDHLISFFKDSEIPLEAEKFHRRIGRSLAGLLNHEIEKGSADSGIQTLKKYDELWIKKSKLLSFNYIKGRIYGKAGMNALAEAYYLKYLNSVDNVNFASTSEKLPSISSTYLYLTRSQIDGNKVPTALVNLEKIKNEELSAEEKTEFFRLKRDIFVARNDYIGAEGHALQITDATKNDYLVLANIYSKQNQADKAVEVIDNYVNTFKPADGEKFEILKTKIDYLSKTTNTDKYKSYLKRFYGEFKNSKNNFDKEKYELGKLYMQEGNVKAAGDVLSKITQGSIWAKLASEYTEQKNWDEKYKKYIDRVPAMKSKGEGK
ncbi:MAG: tetratricopeptide repeat protein [Bdellovibrionaceae bacterium]|nr:tetratricopeptide repeat protein [Pseudobdellovibrionaceae bacterium]